MLIEVVLLFRRLVKTFHYVSQSTHLLVGPTPESTTAHCHFLLTCMRLRNTLTYLLNKKLSYRREAA